MTIVLNPYVYKNHLWNFIKLCISTKPETQRFHYCRHEWGPRIQPWPQALSVNLKHTICKHHKEYCTQDTEYTWNKIELFSPLSFICLKECGIEDMCTLILFKSISAHLILLKYLWTWLKAMFLQHAFVTCCNFIVFQTKSLRLMNWGLTYFGTKVAKCYFFH